MNYRILGKTGLRVSVVGLGGIPLQRITQEETCALVERLAQMGVNFIDTARGYTVSEERLGAALEGFRDKFYIATKSMSRDREHMAADIETSLKNLRTDHIDLYQIHNIKTEADFALAFSEHGALAALQDAVKEGKVHHIGATAHSAEALAELLRHPEIESVMFPYNIVENQGEALFEQAAAQNVGVIAMKPMAGGSIEDGALAMRYILQNPNCTIAIPGMAELAEAEENVSAALDLSPLTEEELARIEEIRKELSGNFCRRCGYCAPCTVGIDIPSCFLMEGYLKRYDLADWARSRYAAMQVKASACVGCGKCETRCPYELPIREKLRAVAAAFGE